LTLIVERPAAAIGAGTGGTSYQIPACAIGTQNASSFIVDAGGNQAAGGGGSVRVESRCHDIVLANQAKLHAKNNTGGGEGGDIVLTGASVTTAAGTEIVCGAPG
jgi:hypothetical protein